MATKYYTYRVDVPLGPHEHVEFRVGRGYYAAPGNPTPFNTAKPPKPAPLSIREQMVHWANWSVVHNRSFAYTQSELRRQMFHRAPGDLSGNLIYADCSQWYAAIGHWVGLKVFTDSDYTGTLLAKGKDVKAPAPGDCCIWGPGTGTHAAMFTGGGQTVGFGHSPGAPNRVSLAAMSAWMNSHGHPGVRFRSFV